MKHLMLSQISRGSQEMRKPKAAKGSAMQEGRGNDAAVHRKL